MGTPGSSTAGRVPGGQREGEPVSPAVTCPGCGTVHPNLACPAGERLTALRGRATSRVRIVPAGAETMRRGRVPGVVMVPRWLGALRGER